MASKDDSPPLRNIFPPLDKLPEPDMGSTAVFLKDSFRLPTLLLFGALLQTLAVSVLPSRYALLPMLILLLRSIITTLLEVFSPSAWQKGLGAGIIPYKVSAQLPDQQTYSSASGSSPFGSRPANRGIVTLHLGIKFSHPLGVLSPSAKEIIDLGAECNRRVMATLSSSDTDFGCLGMTSWQATDSPSHNTLLQIYYFKDLDGLNRFAHDGVHRKAWEFYNQVFCREKGYSHIGVFHEAFFAEKGNWETIYMNIQPTLLGRGMVEVENRAGEGQDKAEVIQETGDGVDKERKGKGGKTEWFSTLVDGSHRNLRGQLRRMGRGETRDLWG